MIKDIDIKDLKTISIKNGRYQHSYEKMTVIIIHNDKQFSFDIKSNSLMIDLDVLKVFDHSDLFDIKEFLQLPLEQQITYIQDKGRVEHMKQLIKVSDTEFDIKRRAYKTGRTLRRTSFSLQQAIIFNQSQDYTQPGSQIILPINADEFVVFEYLPLFNYSVDYVDDDMIYDFFFCHGVTDGENEFNEGASYFEACHIGFNEYYPIKLDWRQYAPIPEITHDLLKRYGVSDLDINLALSPRLSYEHDKQGIEWVPRPSHTRLSLPPFIDEPINAETGERITRTMHLSELREIEKEMKIIDL
jgi:hypothetical protein